MQEFFAKNKEKTVKQVSHKPLIIKKNNDKSN